MTKKELIKHYTKHLEKVKQFHNPNKITDELTKWKCEQYIEQAKQDLLDVKKGRIL